MQLEYNGFTATLSISLEDNCICGIIDGIVHTIKFKSDDIKGISKAFHDALDDYIISCRAEGMIPEKSCSGNVQFRIDPNIHAALLIMAREHGSSLNAYGEALFLKVVSKKFPHLLREKLNKIIAAD